MSGEVYLSRQIQIILIHIAKNVEIRLHFTACFQFRYISIFYEYYGYQKYHRVTAFSNHECHIKET